MLPTLAEIFGEPVPAYFTLLLIGFAAATWLAAHLANAMGSTRTRSSTWGFSA